jgi:hypothetical protein
MYDSTFGFASQIIMNVVSLFAVALSILVIWFGYHDCGQCDRKCRTTYGTGWNDVRYRGRRIGSNKCECWEDENDKQLPEVFRLFESEPAGYPYIEGGKAGVCGDDMAFYETAEEATKNNVSIVNCGSCGACSNVHDVRTYHEMSDTLTKAATKCGISYLLFGDRVAKYCMQKSTTMTDGCIDCWTLNMGCTLTHCFKECVLKFELPINSPNNPEGKADTHAALSSCLLCDEIYCSPNFIRSCGANRRCAGVNTDIGRPENSICPFVNII